MIRTNDAFDLKAMTLSVDLSGENARVGPLMPSISIGVACLV